ncbi:phosphoseryl-tRNA kinase [Seminavis robusta]|uniref:Phosphoseryl-tRNA kinase n=1 Tax=Seminavis robusta TaxID=568900 RepID=A0A9N8ET47_9STRA|nr:phosphoseryl-tRNA kinase [Seminavis robusta]|eukprot:Sro1872_g302790.1 phosphoseryl-tRNA kinase (347) ;mRNA; r:8838-9878
MTTVVVVTCGLPASGKSSLAKWLVSSSCPASILEIGCVEFDKVEDSLVLQQSSVSESATTDYSREIWKKSRAKSMEAFRQTLFQVPANDNTTHAKQQEDPAAAAVTRIIILDDNFHLRSMRREVLRICQEFIVASSLDDTNNPKVYFVTLWVDTPKEICLQRNQTRARKVSPDVIERMSHSLEPPGRDHWEKCYLHIHPGEDGDTTQPSKTTVLDFITHECILQGHEPVAPPPPPVDLEQLEAERRKTRENWLQIWDQRLRTWVGKVPQISRNDTNQANKARKQVLQRLRQYLQQQQRQTDVEELPDGSQISEWFLAAMKVSWSEDQVQAFHTAVLQEVVEDAIQK